MNIFLTWTKFECLMLKRQENLETVIFFSGFLRQQIWLIFMNMSLALKQPVGLEVELKNCIYYASK